MRKYVMFVIFLCLILLAGGVYLFKPRVKDISLAGFGVNHLDIFSNYTSWPSSPNLNPADTTAQALNYSRSRSGVGNTGVTPNYYSHIDINGDNLIDILIHDRFGGGSNYEWTQYYFAIFLNKGNLQFDLKYKCAVYRTAETEGGVYTYYGDCAQ